MGWSCNHGPLRARKFLAVFYGMYMNNDELSIFIDELGDFGKYDIKYPYYIAVLVFHNQSIVISDEIERFNHYLEELGYKNKSDGDNYCNKSDTKNGCSLQPFSLIFFCY